MKVTAKDLSILSLVCLIIWLLGPGELRGGEGSPVVRIGVLANRGIESCLSRWSPTAEYLSEKIPGRRFQIVPVDFHEIHTAVREAQVELIFANPSFFVELEIWYGVNPIATIKNRHTGGVYNRFAGVIFVLDDREDLQTLSDLKDKRFVAVDETSLGGWHMAWREFLEKGIDPYKSFASLDFAGTQDAAVYAVLEGKADAGTVRSDTLERMAAEGRIRLDQFRVFPHQKVETDGVPFLHSTRTYPEWPMAKVRHTDNDLAQQVAIALLQMPPDAPAALAAESGGWGIPLNYQSVHECLKVLKVGPYKDLGRITALQAVRVFWKWLLTAFLGFIVLGTATLIIIGLNRRLKLSNNRLLKEVEWRQKAKEALEESEQFNRTIISSVGDGLVVYDRNLRYHIWNHRMEQMTGLPETDILGQSALELFPHLREQGIERLLERALAGEIVVSPDTPFYVPQTGHSGWVVGSYTPHINTTGQIIGVVGVVSDITHRKVVEAELTASNERFRAVMEGLDALVYVADMKTHELLYMNRHGRETWGDFVGRTCWQVLQRHQQGPCYFCNNRRLLDADGMPTGIHVWEFQNTVNRRWYECRDQAIRWSDDRFVRLEIATDITERKQAEERLHRQNRFLNHVIESLTHPFMVINAEDYTIEIANQAAGEFFEGCKCYHLTHRSEHPCDGLEHPCPVKIIKSSRHQAVVEHVHFDRHGELRTVEVYGYPILDDRGEVSKIIEYSLDITDRKQAERELQEKEEYFRTIMSTIQTGVLVSEQGSGRIVDANPFAADLIGVDTEAVIGNPWSIYLGEGVSRDESARDGKLGEDGQLKTLQGETLSVRLSEAHARIRDQLFTIHSFLDISDIQELLRQQAVSIELARGLLALVNPGFTRYFTLEGNLGLHIEAISLPCFAVGGDHFFVRQLPGNVNGVGPGTYLSLKDQSGHQVNCILRSIFTDLVHNAILQDDGSMPFEHGIRQLNERLIRGGTFGEENFLTAIMARIDHATLTMQYASCGHPPFLLIREGNVVSLPEINGHGQNLPLGNIEEVRFSAGRLILQKGDKLLLYTDGLTEMPLEKHGWKLSRERLEKVVFELVQAKKSRYRVNDLMRDLLAQVACMSDQRVQYPNINSSADDVTLVILEVEDLSGGQQRVLVPKTPEELGEQIRELAHAIAEEWEGAGLTQCTRRVRVVLEEGLLNAWKSGHRGQLGLPITVRWRESNDFHLEIIDTGGGFDPDRVSDPTLPQNSLKISGRGIHMIRMFADEVHWRDGGRHLTASFFRYHDQLEAFRRKPYRSTVPLWQSNRQRS